MKRVLVIGCPGSGKSTFAKALGKARGLPVIHLDRLHWQEDATNVPMEVFLARLWEALQGESWIIDGNYASTLETRLAFCDTVFFLDLDVDTCLEGIAKRRGQPHSDLPWLEPLAPDEEFTEYVRNFPRDGLPLVRAALEKFPKLPVYTFTSREQMTAYLQALEQAGA